MAIKVVRSIKKYRDAAEIEADILNDLYDRQKERCGDSERRYVVTMYSHFNYHGHYCLVFERLGMSLYEFIKRNDYRGFPMEIVRRISFQLVSALRFIHSCGLIHTDLKLENILLVDSASQVSTHPSYFDRTHKDSSSRKSADYVLPLRTDIKLIDFGSATYDNDRHKSRIISTRQYRGPEVTLELGWSYPSDIWSAGCIVSEIYTGELLFPTHDNLEHLVMMDKITQSSFPLCMIDDSPVRQKFFHSDGALYVEALDDKMRRYVRNEIVSLPELLSREGKRSGLLDLLQRLLALNPDDRLTASQAMRHEFFDAL